MTVFNLWFGQARASQAVNGRPVRMYHRHTTPKSRVQLSREESRRPAVEYRVDGVGNIEVTDDEDIANLTALGYPRYVGFGGDFNRSDLLFFMDPLEPEPYRSLTAEEWLAHEEAVIDAYTRAALEDSRKGQLTPTRVERYVHTIRSVGRAMDSDDFLARVG